MQVILLERVRNLGFLGDVVRVKPGYARNYLLPYGKAVSATKENVAAFEERRAELEKAEAEVLMQAKKRAEALANFVLTMKRKASDEGKLYGSVSLYDIVDALNGSSMMIERRELILPEGAIRSVGEHLAEIHLHSDVVVEIKVVIEAE